MQVHELTLPGVLEITPRQHGDDRGVFLEVFRADLLLAAAGRRFELAQVNTSVSARGVLRGLHFAQLPPGQAKYVFCTTGAAFDVTVDLRRGSATFGQWHAVILDDVDRRAVFIPEGFGHAFMALADDTVVTYFCSAPFSPGREHGVHPQDPELGISWPTTGRDGHPLTPVLSPKDRAAPSLTGALESGLLPTIEEWDEFLRTAAGPA